MPPSDVSRTHGELDVTVIDDPHDAEAIRGQWDELAVAAGRPYCSPAWMLSWWARARTGDARLRTIVIRDRSSVLAIAPFFAQVGRLGLTEYRLLAAGISHRIGVLWREGHELALAEPLGHALGRLHPRPSSIVWEGIDARDESPARSAPALSGPAGVKLRRDAALDAPTIHLAGRSFEEWLGATSNKFRRGILRERRNLVKCGGTIRRTLTLDELETDLPTFARLHSARWADRGGSGFFDARMMAMLRDVAGWLLHADRFRLYLVELEGTPIAATICVVAGATVAVWGSGMDNANARFSPTRLAFVSAIEEACERGERQFDLGGGQVDYKFRYTDHNEPVVWITQFPRGLRYPVTRAQLLPKHVRYHLRDLARRLPAERQQQLKRIVRRK